MPTFSMPAIGKSGQSGTVRKWFKAAGQSFAKGELLLEVETEDGVVQVEAGRAGTLQKVLLEIGKTGAPGTAIAEYVEQQGTKEQSSAQSAAEVKPMEAKKSGGAVVPVLMPQAGQSMEEGTIVKWHVKVGDRIKKGQVIFEVETDKATLEVEAVDEGRIAKIVLGEGGTIAVKQPVAFLAENDADVDGVGGAAVETPAAPAATPAAATAAAVSAAPAAAPAAAAASAPAPAVMEGGRVKASPAARAIAEQRGVNLAAVGTGSGPGGRILSTDVLAAKPGTAAAAAPAVPVIPSAPPPRGTEIVRTKMSKMRKAIAANLSASKQTIPHFYVRTTVDAGPMFAFYKAEKAKYQCSVNDVVTGACARAVAEFPQFRSRIDKDEIVELPKVNIGIAVGIDDGLTVPVLVNADQMNLEQLATNTRRIVENARKGKLEGLGQGVFTITNLGMFGVEEFAAIVNPPEAAILAVGAARESVIVKDGAMKPGRVMTVTLSCDHRIIDGLLAAKFLARLKELMENPSWLA